jgi:hypothetical protein
MVRRACVTVSIENNVIECLSIILKNTIKVFGVKEAVKDKREFLSRWVYYGFLCGQERYTSCAVCWFHK